MADHQPVAGLANIPGARGYISAQGVQNLESYSYRGKDQSILAQYVLRHFWDWLLNNFVPPTLAPNIITLCGFSCIISAFLLLSYYTQSLAGGWAPNWVFFVVAFLIFCYQTFDNLDGKQARKTGSSSALGEVFDHGTDALTVPVQLHKTLTNILLTIVSLISIILDMMFVLILGTSFQFGPTLTWVMLLMLGTLFYLPHWEGYFTGVLLLRPTSNPTEGQWMLILLLLWTSFKGTLWWREDVYISLLGFVQYNNLLLFFAFLGFVNTVYEHFDTLGSSFRIAVEYAENIYWHDWDIRIIVQGVTKEPFKIYYNILSPIVVFLFLSIIGKLISPILEDEFILSVYFLVVLFHNFFLAASLVYEFSFYLNIHPFSIRPQTVLPTVHEEKPTQEAPTETV